MAKAKNKNAAKSAGGEKPLFTASYDLDYALVDEASRAMVDSKVKNPAGITSVAILAVIVLVALSPAARVATPALLLLVMIEVGLWYLADNWNKHHFRRLCKAGLDATLLPRDKRRRSVRVFERHVEVTDADGDVTRAEFTSLFKAHQGRGIIVLEFRDPYFVILPESAMSAQRFHELSSFVEGLKK